MRPVGVTLIAILHWLRGAAYAAVGFALIGFAHLNAHMIASVTGDTFFQRLVSGLGKTLGVAILLFALLYIVMGFGLWAMKSWARILTLIFAVIWGLAHLYACWTGSSGTYGTSPRNQHQAKLP